MPAYFKPPSSAYRSGSSAWNPINQLNAGSIYPPIASEPPLPVGAEWLQNIGLVLWRPSQESHVPARNAKPVYGRFVVLVDDALASAAFARRPGAPHFVPTPTFQARESDVALEVIERLRPGSAAEQKRADEANARMRALGVDGTPLAPRGGNVRLGYTVGVAKYLIEKARNAQATRENAAIDELREKPMANAKARREFALMAGLSTADARALERFPVTASIRRSTLTTPSVGEGLDKAILTSADVPRTTTLGPAPATSRPAPPRPTSPKVPSETSETGTPWGKVALAVALAGVVVYVATD